MNCAFLIVLVLENLAGTALARGESARANAFIEEALPLRRTTGDTCGVPYSLAMQREIAQRDSTLMKALEYYRQTIALSYDRGDQGFVVGGLIRMDNLVAELGRSSS